MLNPKFQGHRLTVLEKKIFEGVLPYTGIVAILVMWHTNKLSFSHPLRLQMKFGFNQPCGFREDVWKWLTDDGQHTIEDGQTMEHDHTISSQAAFGFGELKKHCFHSFPSKSLSGKIWPCCEIGQGHPRVIIWTNYDGPKYQMQHAKF